MRSNLTIFPQKPTIFIFLEKRLAQIIEGGETPLEKEGTKEMLKLKVSFSRNVISR
jgi:hypothetical protein